MPTNGPAGNTGGALPSAQHVPIDHDAHVVTQYGCCTVTQQPRLDSLVFAALLALVLVTVCAVSAVMRGPRRRRIAMVLGAILGWTGLAVVAQSLPVGAEHVLAEPRPDETVCRDGEPRVCPWPESAADLPAVGGWLSSAWDVWEGQGFDLDRPVTVSDFAVDPDLPALGYRRGSGQAQTTANAAYLELVTRGGGGMCAVEVPGVQGRGCDQISAQATHPRLQFLPVLTAVALAWAVRLRDDPRERFAHRPPVLLDVGLLAAGTMLSALTTSLVILLVSASALAVKAFVAWGYVFSIGVLTLLMRFMTVHYAAASLAVIHTTLFSVSFLFQPHGRFIGLIAQGAPPVLAWSVSAAVWVCGLLVLMRASGGVGRR